MATVQELERALINADAAGDTQAAQALAQAIMSARSAVPEQKPARGLYPGEGVVRGMYDPIEGMAQMAYNALPQGVRSAGDKFNNYLAEKTGLVPMLPKGGLNEAIAQGEADYQKARGGGFDTQRMIGNVLSPVNLTAANAVPATSTLLGRTLAGAGYGAANAMTMPVTQGDYLEGKKAQAGSGAVFGGAMAPLVSGISRIVSPNASVIPEVALMRREGVPMTVGQTGGGLMNRMEEKLQSWPFIGDAITDARERAREGFNRAAINRTVAPIGQKVNEVGTEGVRQAGNALSDAYDSALNGLQGIVISNQGARNINSVINSARMNLPKPGRQVFDRKIEEALGGTRISPANGMLADVFKKADSDLGRSAAKYRGSSVSSEQEAGDALLEIQRVLRSEVSNQSPEYAAALRNTDKGWANLTRVENAAVSAKLNDGVFTPGQLLGAVTRGDTRVRHRGVARGEALMQDLASAGQKTIGNKYPDSGTAGRLASVTPLLDQAIALPSIAAMPVYSPQVQQALTYAMTQRPASSPMLADMLRKSIPFLAPIGPGLLDVRP